MSANKTTAYNASNQNVTLNATVTSAGGTVNEGTVVFQLKNGAAKCGFTGHVFHRRGRRCKRDLCASHGGTAPGVYTIVATYGSGANFAGSSNSTHTLTVNAAATTTAGANQSAAYNAANQNVTLNATVTSAGGTVSEGTVVFH